MSRRMTAPRPLSGCACATRPAALDAGADGVAASSAKASCRVKFAARCLSCEGAWYSAITIFSSQETDAIRLVDFRVAGPSEPRQPDGSSGGSRGTVVAATFSNMAFDIAVVTDCGTRTEHLEDFARHLQVPKRLRDKLRILVNTFRCSHSNTADIKAAFFEAPCPVLAQGKPTFCPRCRGHFFFGRAPLPLARHEPQQPSPLCTSREHFHDYLRGHLLFRTVV